MRILVLSTFDIYPPRDGGQTRYCELWRQFSSQHDIVVLPYEFRNTQARRIYKLAPNVSVIVAVAELGDAARFHEAAAQTGLWLHDVLCIRRHIFSADFLSCLSTQVATADVVVASHPYLAHLAFPMVRRGVLKVYESHNVETDIKREYLSTSHDKSFAADLLGDVKWVEAYAAAQADLVSAVSVADRERLRDLFQIPAHKLIVAPNGTSVSPASNDRKTLDTTQKASCGLGPGLVGVFLGSAFGPNVLSYKRTRGLLEQVGFDGTILLIGSIADADKTGWPSVGFKEIWLGFVDAEVRDGFLQLADFALHLIFAGAGTNLKLFDYMSAGLPIISNQHGRRGCDDPRLWFFSGETPQDLRAALLSIGEDAQGAGERGRVASLIATERFSWSAIARDFEKALVFGIGDQSTMTPGLSSRDLLRSGQCKCMARLATGSRGRKLP